MMTKESKPMPAPLAKDVIRKRAKAIEHVVSQWRSDSERGVISAEELASKVGASEATAKKLIHELDEVFRDVRASPRADALVWGGTTYYEKSLGHNRELKQEIATK